MRNFVLKDGEPVEEMDVAKWLAWFEPADLRVAKTWVGGYLVSTIFMGADYARDGGPPVLWETAVFDGGRGVDQERCGGGRAAALAMHERMVEAVRGKEKA